MSTIAPELPYPEVATTAETERFWSELAAGRVVVDWCPACDTHVWPPAERCRHCMGLADDERVLPGTGRIYSYSVVHRPARGFPAPYVLAYVELDGGPTVMANIVDTDPERVAVGAAVEFVPPSGEVERGALRFRVR